MGKDFTVIGLDIETSGSDVNKHALLSIGAVDYLSGRQWEAHIKHVGDILVVPEAMRVNQIDVKELDSIKRKTLEDADYEFLNFLFAINVGWESKIIPCGFNVGGFDMPFVKKYLPRSFAHIGYRSIDLNALIFQACLKEETQFEKVKSGLKSYAREVTKLSLPDRNDHDALFDAVMACHILNFLNKGEER